MRLGIVLLIILLAFAKGTAEEIHIPGSGPIRSIIWTEHGIVTSALDTKVYYFDLRDNTTISFEAASLVYSLEVRNGSIFVGTAVGSLQVFDLNGNLLNSLNYDTDYYISALEISPNGQFLAAAYSNLIFEPNFINVIDLTDFSLNMTIYAHADTIGSISWSPSGELIASTSSDGALTISRAFTGEQLYYIPLGYDYGSEVKWSPDGDWIAMNSVKGTLSFISPDQAKFEYNVTGSDISTMAWREDGELFAFDSLSYQILQFSIGTKLERLNVTTMDREVATIDIQPGINEPKLALGMRSGDIVLLEGDYQYQIPTSSASDDSFTLSGSYTGSWPPVLPIFGFVLVVTIVFALWRWVAGTASSNGRKAKKSPPTLLDNEVDPQTTYLQGYGRVRICCYNAARVGDGYCLCGRAIPQELRDQFGSRSER